MIPANELKRRSLSDKFAKISSGDSELDQLAPPSIWEMSLNYLG
jgi:hypothetical protein